MMTQLLNLASAISFNATARTTWTYYGRFTSPGTGVVVMAMSPAHKVRNVVLAPYFEVETTIASAKDFLRFDLKHPRHIHPSDR